MHFVCSRPTKLVDDGRVAGLVVKSIGMSSDHRKASTSFEHGNKELSAHFTCSPLRSSDANQAMKASISSLAKPKATSSKRFIGSSPPTSVDMSRALSVHSIISHSAHLHQGLWVCSGVNHGLFLFTVKVVGIWRGQRRYRSPYRFFEGKLFFPQLFGAALHHLLSFLACKNTCILHRMDRVMRLASQRAVVVFSLSSCCMCHTIKRLFCELGVNPGIHELDEDPNGKDMERALARMLGCNPPVPAVFIGGRLVGRTDRVMSLHLGGKLVPLLRDAGAIWL
ncbi:hypothetical protein C4D60_Mb11t05340 [Musa balbisiana]|uniref:Glutaredoxin domain-containing protein n=1 Tax=Musa balbisiana TaxID=52838 RepID=A0A4S8J1V9_MUSBA|nr:hypothetical protein C4D60_Mb11t05340 [Musa balbisiana]